MSPILVVVTLCGFLILPNLAGAQTSGGPRLDGDRQAVFQSLKDSQWVRLSGAGLGRRDGKVLDVTPTEIVLTPRPAPIHVAATSIDTVWTRPAPTPASVSFLEPEPGTTVGREARSPIAWSGTRTL